MNGKKEELGGHDLSHTHAHIKLSHSRTVGNVTIEGTAAEDERK